MERGIHGCFGTRGGSLAPRMMTIKPNEKGFEPSCRWTIWTLEHPVPRWKAVRRQPFQSIGTCPSRSGRGRCRSRPAVATTRTTAGQSGAASRAAFPTGSGLDRARRSTASPTPPAGGRRRRNATYCCGPPSRTTRRDPHRSPDTQTSIRTKILSFSDTASRRPRFAYSFIFFTPCHELESREWLRSKENRSEIRC